MREIAALFVQTGGAYYGLEGVDPWDEARDARLYVGDSPVVAHPPCSRWCRLAPVVEKRWGHKRHEDGGCFGFALKTVRRVGGVLEHPAYSDAWKAFGLARPTASGGWVKADEHGGWTCQVEQGMYGHPARKRTWLYAVGCELPDLRWGQTPPENVRAWVSQCLNGGGDQSKPRLSPKKASATPPEFREVLLAMARSVGRKP